jgi:hypothetical protein
MAVVTLTIPPRQFSSTFAFIFIAVLQLRSSLARVLDSFDVFSSKKPNRVFIPEKTGRLYDLVLMGAKARVFHEKMHVLSCIFNSTQYTPGFSKEPALAF